MSGSNEAYSIGEVLKVKGTTTHLKKNERIVGISGYKKNRTKGGWPYL